MSGKLKYVIISLLSLVLFLAVGFIADRHIFHYPFIIFGTGLKREQSAILRTIDTYNSILSDFHASGGIPALLNEFPATKGMRHEVFRDIGFIRDGKRVLVYDRADTLPVEIRLSSSTRAEAVVFEEWNYLYQRLDDRKPVTKVRGLGQGFRYKLVMKQGRWLIRAWDPVHVEDAREKDFLF